MALTKKGNFTFNHADQINDPNWSSEQTKANFDKRAEEMRVAHNGLIDELDLKITEYDASKQDYETHKAAGTTGAHTASNIAVTDTAGNFTATDVEGTLSELFTSVSNGKQKVSTAITGKGGTVADADSDGVPTFTELANAIDDVAAWDADLTPENLRSGIEVLGVTGVLEEGIDTTDATASAGDILLNKTAYVNDIKVVGSMPDVGQQIITPGIANKAITAGKHDGTGYVKGDSNLKPENILINKEIYGVSGTVNPAPPDSIIHWYGVNGIYGFEPGYSSDGETQWEVFPGDYYIAGGIKANISDAWAGSGSQHAFYATTSTIDLTCFNKISALVFTMDYSIRVYVQAATSRTGSKTSYVVSDSDYVRYTDGLNSSQNIEVDVSGLTGSYYIKIGLEVSNSGDHDAIIQSVIAII